MNSLLFIALLGHNIDSAFVYNAQHKDQKAVLTACVTETECRTQVQKLAEARANFSTFANAKFAYVNVIFPDDAGFMCTTKEPKEKLFHGPCGSPIYDLWRQFREDPN